MKILQANKFFYLRGGSERYFFDLCRLLTAHGHRVEHFSMQHPRNVPSDQAEYFVSGIDFNAPMNPFERGRAAVRILYSMQARRKIGSLLDASRPDVVHVHNISRQLSPSIIGAAKQRGIPVIQTLHDLSLVCPAHSFFVDGRPCEDCAGGAYWHAVPKKCIDGLLGSTILGTVEAYLHSWMRLYRRIDLFIAPSMFLQSKVSSLKWIRAKVVHLPYLIPLGPDCSSRDDGYVLFAGRISKEKGVETLLEAASMLSQVRFLIAGEGPPLADYRRRVDERGLTNVEFLGYIGGSELETLVQGCRCVMVPSISYENLPLSILEAFAMGKPVVGSDCGGIPELVKNGTTGYLFDRGDPSSLAESLRQLLADDATRVEMGRRARETVAQEYSPETHYQRLMDIYQGICR